MKLLDTFGTETLDPGQRFHVDRKILFQVLIVFELAGVEVLCDLLCDRLADSLDVLEFIPLVDRFDVFGECLDAPGCVAVRTRFVLDIPHFEEVGDLVETRCYFVVLHHVRTSALTP